MRARAVKPHIARRLGCIIILLCYTARNLYTRLGFFFYIRQRRRRWLVRNNFFQPARPFVSI